MFKVGDRVVATAPHDGNRRIIGASGKVVYLHNEETVDILVLFDEPVGGHEAARAFGEDNVKVGSSWWVDPDKLKLEVVSLENI